MYQTLNDMNFNEYKHFATLRFNSDYLSMPTINKRYVYIINIVDIIMIIINIIIKYVDAYFCKTIKSSVTSDDRINSPAYFNVVCSRINMECW